MLLPAPQTANLQIEHELIFFYENVFSLHFGHPTEISSQSIQIMHASQPLP